MELGERIRETPSNRLIGTRKIIPFRLVHAKWQSAQSSLQKRLPTVARGGEIVTVPPQEFPCPKKCSYRRWAYGFRQNRAHIAFPARRIWRLRLCCRAKAPLFPDCLRRRSGLPWRAGFRDHQHTNHRNDVAPKHHRNIKPKTKCDGQPHPAERMVIVLFGALVKQHNHKQP